MARIDPRKELESLDDAIAKQESEIGELELFVVKNSSVPSDEERKAVKQRLAEYEQVLEEYSAALAARGLSRNNRPETTTKYLVKLLGQSEDARNRREKLKEEVERLKEELRRRESRADARRKRAVTDFTHAKEFIERVREELKKLLEALDQKERLGEMREYTRRLKAKENNVFPGAVEQLKAKIARLEKEASATEAKLSEEIEAAEKANDAEKQRQAQAKKSQSAAQREYEASLEKKRSAERICGQEREQIQLLANAIQRNVSRGEKWAKIEMSAKLDGFGAVHSLKTRVEKVCEKFEGMKDPLYIASVVVSAESNPGDYGFTMPKEMKYYANVRRKVLSTIDPSEFRFFLLSDADLLKWYQIVKDRFAKDQAKYGRETATSRESLSAAKVKYDMILKRVKRLGLEPLTE